MALKTILITGAKQGMGYHMASMLAKKNHRIILCDKQDLDETREEIIRSSCNENITCRNVDLSSFCSVRSFAEEVNETEDQLHVLINNAGVFASECKETEDGLNPTMQINHFSPFLLTHLLSEKLKISAPSRIIFVTSSGAFLSNLTVNNLIGGTRFRIDLLSETVTYYNSKLCNMIASKGFADKLKDFEVTSNCFHPGMMNSDFLFKPYSKYDELFKSATKKLFNFVTKPVENGAKLGVYLATSEELNNVTGQYFSNYQIHEQPLKLVDYEFCHKIWCQSEEITKIRNN